jgi:hypothetical protein
MRTRFHEGKHTSLTILVDKFCELRRDGVLRSSLVGTEKAQTLKKVRLGGAPELDEEYGVTVTHKGCVEDSGNRQKGIFI